MPITPTDLERKKALKILAQSRFNVERVHKIFIDSLGPSLAFGESIRKSLEARRPFFEDIARRANELTLAFESINKIQNDSTLKMVSDAQEKVKSLLTNLMPLELESPYPIKEDRFYSLPSSLPVQSKISAEEIAERVYQKLNANAKGKAKNILYKAKRIVLLPEGTNWEDLKIIFKNEFDVIVKLKDKYVNTYNCATLGFVKKSSHDKPNRQWELLRLFALLSSNPMQMKLSIENLSKMLKISGGAFMKAKEFLAKKLQSAFGLEGDPFWEYNADLGYQPVFKIQSETILRHGEPYTHGRQIIDMLDPKK